MFYPLVTIGIPTYNKADGFLKEAIQSALDQTYANIEIIVSDNCSTDNTTELIKQIRDNRLEYNRHEVNIGPNNNFNYCLKQASGEYFLLLHDDDLIDHDFVEVCMQAADINSDYGIIRTGTRKIDSKGGVLSESPNRAVGLSTLEFIRKWFACETSFYLCSTLFNTGKLRGIGGFESKNNVFQDVFAEIRLVAKYGRVDVEDVKASFRVHGDQLTFSAGIGPWCEDSLLLLDLICDLFPEHRALIRKEGMQFLSTLNYSFASSIKSRYDRWKAYMIVFRSYTYRHPPPPVTRRLKKLKRLAKVSSQ